MKEEKPPKVVSLLERLARRARERGESVTPMVRRTVLAAIEEASKKQAPNPRAQSANTPQSR